MTNGRGPAAAGMASFMTKKKKYKFQVEICLEELLEVPFVSAVLFAKLRLLDGGNFQDYSSRQEVRDHKVLWNSSFAFPCKMLANASTGVMERCVLRVSIRKESKGGRSFAKLGFVDLNLAEYAGAGLVRRKALLEGYDARRRQDNSMLRFKIELSMVSGDIVFKAPSPTLKHKQVNAEETGNEQRSDEFSSGSLAGSIASGSSGFGSLPKKRPALLSSELVIGQTLTENNVPVTIACEEQLLPQHHPPTAVSLQASDTIHHETASEPGGHSRNSSNTSQLSKASGYSSSIHSHTHSRQSSSGDSGHIRDLHSRSVRTRNISNTNNMFRTNTYPKKITIPKTISSSNQEVFSTPCAMLTSTPIKNVDEFSNLTDASLYATPKGFQSQTSYVSNSSNDEYKTPENKVIGVSADVFSQNFNKLQHSSSTSLIEKFKSMRPFKEADTTLRSGNESASQNFAFNNRHSLEEFEKNRKNTEGVLRSKSEFQIPIMPIAHAEKSLATKLFSSDSLFSFLTPRPKRKSLKEQHSPRGRESPTNLFKNPGPPPLKLNSLPESRTTSLSSLRSGSDVLCVQSVNRGMSHRKLLDGAQGGKLTPLAISPDEPADASAATQPVATLAPPEAQLTARRPSVTTNPSASSLVISETGSLDRAKAAYERRKKCQAPEGEAATSQGRVEITRVNPDHLIEELLKSTNLEQPDDSAENSGLQLFIGKDGTLAFGNEVKSEMSTGAQAFKQIVMDDR